MAHVRAAWFAASLAAAVGVAACHREAPSAAPSPTEEPSAKPAAGPEVHEPLFDLVMKPVGAVTAGQPSTVEITVNVKGGYHPNEKYPYKFKPAGAEGVHYAAPTFSTEALKLEPARATMTVGFTPEGKGDKTIAGLFAFSLCSADNCLIEKRDLALQIVAN